ncbi:MAG: cysteine desulfurase family protein [Candidatus Binatia bacterium]
MIYLDYNATAPLCAAARAAMLAVFDGACGNPSSAHAGGRASRGILERARRAIAARLGAQPSEVLFTSGASESNNVAVLGTIPEAAGAHLVASPIEHASVLGPVRELERRGAEVTWLAVDAAGRITPAAVAAALRPQTALVTVGWANGEIGTVQPIAEIAALCRSAGARLHVDAAQAVGKVPVELTGVDLCSISAHKIGGPVGIGALIARRGAALRPLAWGGGQERGVRPGTENTAGAAGFAAALGALPDFGACAPLRERLWAGIAALGGVRRYSPMDDCLPNTLNIGFAGVRGEALVAALDLEGVAISVGSACAAGAGEPSPVLRAIGCSGGEAVEGVRFSLGAATSAAEIDAAVAALARVIERMRSAGRWRAAVA